MSLCQFGQMNLLKGKFKFARDSSVDLLDCEVRYFDRPRIDRTNGRSEREMTDF